MQMTSMDFFNDSTEIAFGPFFPSIWMALQRWVYGWVVCLYVHATFTSVSVVQLECLVYHKIYFFLLSCKYPCSSEGEVSIQFPFDTMYGIIGLLYVAVYILSEIDKVFVKRFKWMVLNRMSYFFFFFFLSPVFVFYFVKCKCTFSVTCSHRSFYHRLGDVHWKAC